MTKERLRKYRQIERERKQLLEKLEEVEAALYYPKIQQMTDMPRGGLKEGNPQEDLAIHHIELQRQYNAKLVELAAEQLAIEQAIDSLDPVDRMIMRYRYIDCLKWEEVCVKIGYSWTQTHEHHGRALKQLKEKSE